MKTKKFKFEGIGELELKEVSVQDLFLDPNNPRFMGVESKKITVESKIMDDKIQDRALENMKKYSIKELRENIEEVGFLPMDKMVFAEIKQHKNKFYCLEGNRRLAAIKWLLKDYQDGEASDVKEDIINKLQKLEVYILINAPDFRRAQHIIQGVRHMSGIKDWRPYQKAEVIFELINNGKKPNEISKMFGTNPQGVMKYYRSYLACQGYINDENYGQYWDIEMFRMFYDIIGRPRLRIDWLDWDEETKVFKNTTELEYFYKWITKDEETGERKISGANLISDLDAVVGNDDALSYLKNDGSSLIVARSMALKKTKIIWIDKVNELLELLKELPVADLESLKKDDENKLIELDSEIKNTIKRAKKLKKK